MFQADTWPLAGRCSSCEASSAVSFWKVSPWAVSAGRCAGARRRAAQGRTNAFWGSTAFGGPRWSIVFRSKTKRRKQKSKKKRACLRRCDRCAATALAVKIMITVDAALRLRCRGRLRDRRSHVNTAIFFAATCIGARARRPACRVAKISPRSQVRSASATKRACCSRTELRSWTRTLIKCVCFCLFFCICYFRVPHLWASPQ